MLPYGDSVNLKGMRLGYAPGYQDKKLEKMEAALAPISAHLAERIEEVVFPPQD